MVDLGGNAVIVTVLAITAVASLTASRRDPATVTAEPEPATAR